ncbi:MAG: glycosyltransferase family 4 protein [Anaerolineales bacterium]|jgi:glycosyltransferase involved in cell wall biosynthesis
MAKPPKILFVCHAGSTHAQSWINLLIGSGFDVRVFTVRFDSPQYIPPWDFTTYSAIQPHRDNLSKTSVIWLLPDIPRLKTFIRWFQDRFSIRDRWLHWLINNWKPDILHSFPLDTGSRPAKNALVRINKNNWPKWVVSAWGSDLYIGLDDPDANGNLSFILQHCDGFMADCQRDLKLAEDHGLIQEKLAFPYPLPGAGGLDLDKFSKIRDTYQERDLILVPKAFDREFANRILPTLEALRLVEDAIAGYEIHLLNSSRTVQIWLKKQSASFHRRCTCHDMLPQETFFELLGRTRLVISPSLSDGTPNVLLEAMGAGTLPIFSPLDSIKEWIQDGENGLLVHALYPDKIANAIQRGLTDNELFYRAKEKNWEIVKKKANRSQIREQVLTYYQGLSGR